VKNIRISVVLVCVCFGMLVGGCSVGQRTAGWNGLQQSESTRFVILPLADCIETPGSGVACQEILARILQSQFRSMIVDAWTPPGYNAMRVYSTDDALALCRQRAATYVLFGECKQFSSKASGLDIRVVQVSDGLTVYSWNASLVGPPGGGEEPRGIIKDIAEEIAKEMSAK